MFSNDCMSTDGFYLPMHTQHQFLIHAIEGLCKAILPWACAFLFTTFPFTTFPFQRCTRATQ